ncbi:F-box/LRR-repeat protein At1g48400-like [Triticum aestivum]|uniref:F-box/LRR-repeat protein At1g48400-like n=1 Tax=Triticum aestivum TaxID=4565 RepID=UPI001D00CE91|nr:F-box/LRR-repeat protein At1g48400-like [Triticum aestivum]
MPHISVRQLAVVATVSSTAGPGPASVGAFEAPRDVHRARLWHIYGVDELTPSAPKLQGGHLSPAFLSGNAAPMLSPVVSLNLHADLPLDEMHRSTTQRPGRRRGAGRAAAKRDHLSALPDELLHHIMSFLKAWEVVHTCVLARRWRHLWASVPCVNLRVHPSTGRYGDPSEKFRDFVHRLFLLREASAPVVMLRLWSSDEEAGFTDDDASVWMRAAIKRNARVIHLTGCCSEIASLDRVSFISCHLKVLKLSYAMLDYRILRQLSSSCTSLEVLGLKDCLVAGPRIVSASLKTLIMLECEISCAFSIAAPNLLLLHLITPYVRVPSFKNLGSLVTATIILDDSFLGDDNEYISDEDYCDGTTDDDGDDTDYNDWTESSKIHDESSLSDNVGYDDFIRFGYGHGFAEGIYRHDRYKDNYNYGGFPVKTVSMVDIENAMMRRF